MIQIEVDNQLYIMKANQNALTTFNDTAQNELRINNTISAQRYSDYFLKVT